MLSWLLLMLCSALSLPAQNAVLRGIVTDQSGAFVPGATVVLTGPGGLSKTATAGPDGGYTFDGLVPGEYTLQASAPQLVLEKAQTLTIRSGVQTLNPRLSVASITQQIVVDDNPAPAISTDAASNATATVLHGDDLDSLSDNPEDLQADLEALAGPSAGPGGNAIFIDGFSSGDLPAKEAIREIRINQNPFSPEFDKLGLGRIEIFTKPGSDKYHGSFNYNFANQFWNSRNPYSGMKAPLSLNEFENTFSGPAGKRASFAVDASQNNIDNGSIINAVIVPAGTVQITPLLDTFRTVQRRTRLAPRVDYQLDENNTVTLRYGFIRGDIEGAGIGGFSLTEHGIHTHFLIQTAQIVETSVHGSTVNETRFQLYRNASEMQANTPKTAEIRVLGSFTGGGSPLGDSLDTLTNFELHNNTTSVHGAHTFRFGARARHAIENSVAPQDFYGTFIFTGGLGPALDENNQPVLDASGQQVMTQITSIERYRRTLLFQAQGLIADKIAARGGGPAQLTIATGTPGLTVRRWDIGVFAGDDWRLRPNLTVNLGLRYENQTNIHDPRDLAPRIGVAWAPGSRANNPRPKLVVRAGFGIFYDRFLLMDTLTAARYNGIVQHQYVIANPDFSQDPKKVDLAPFQSGQVIQQVSPALRSPYIVQSAITLERQLPANTTVAVTYNNSRGFRELRSRDANAPRKYDPANPGSGEWPLGQDHGPLFVVESPGIFRQNQLSVNVNSRVSPTISLFGTYVFGHTMSDTEGAGTFAANPYDLKGEYGPALYDIRHRLNFGGSINTKWNVRISPLIALQSGPPFDITTGSDFYGTSLFNARPGIAADGSKPGVIFTPKYGWLDPSPSQDEALIPRNFGRGPGQMSVNLRVAKIFGFGAERKPAKSSGGIFAVPAERHYTVTLALGIRNLLNHRNPGQIIGNITSPLFGQANQMAGNLNGEGFSENANNRRLELQIKLAF